MKNFFVKFVFSTSVFGFIFLFGMSRSLPADDSAAAYTDYHQNRFISEYGVHLILDKEDLQYKGGDIVEGRVIAESEGYLYLFDYGADQELSLSYPDKYTKKGENKIKKGETGIPRLSVRPPYGKETFIAYLSEKDFDLDAEGEKNRLTAEIQERLSDQGDHHRSRPWKSAVDMVEITTFPDPSTRFFCSIGIDQYEDYPDLRCCENDAIDIEMLFKEKCHIDEDNCRRLINSDAAYENIKDLFCTYLPEKTVPGSVIFVYWSGHGDLIPDSRSGKKYRSCFVLPHTKRDRLEETALTESEFGDWIQNLSGRRIIFILDTCYSGGFVEGTKGIGGPEMEVKFLEFDFEPNAEDKAIGLEGNAIICACGPGEKAMPGIYNSLMTEHILKALRLLGEDETLTPAELVDAIQDQIKNQHLQVNGELLNTVLINTP